MICEQCHKENRGIAKYCKWCGKPLTSQNVLEKLVGLGELKKQLCVKMPDFSPKTYGYSKFSRFVENLPGFRIKNNTVLITEK